MMNYERGVARTKTIATITERSDGGGDANYKCSKASEKNNVK
jgi:hypothetical protein